MIINHANHELYYQQKILSSIIDELGTSIYKKLKKCYAKIFYRWSLSYQKSLSPLNTTNLLRCQMKPFQWLQQNDTCSYEWKYWCFKFTFHWSPNRSHHANHAGHTVVMSSHLLFSWKTQQGWKVRIFLKDQSQYVALSMCILITERKILTLFTLSSRRSKFYREESAGKYFADDFSGNSRDYLAITC